MTLKISDYDKFGSFYFLKLAGILFFFFWATNVTLTFPPPWQESNFFADFP